MGYAQLEIPDATWTTVSRTVSRTIAMCYQPVADAINRIGRHTSTDIPPAAAHSPSHASDATRNA